MRLCWGRHPGGKFPTGSRKLPATSRQRVLWFALSKKEPAGSRGFYFFTRANPQTATNRIPLAARYMGHMRPWRQARPTWDYAAELVLRAAITGRRADIEAATDQRALLCDGWL